MSDGQKNTQSPAKRLKLEFPVQFKKNYARNKDEAIIKNISLTGAYIDVADCEKFNLHEKITLTFQVSGRLRDLSANVVWKNSEGCGVKFKHFNNRDVQIIDDLMFFIESQNDSKRTVLDNIFKVVS